MQTLTAARPLSRPIAPDSARRAAVAFIAEGITAAQVREDMHPADVALTQIAAAMDSMTGLTPADARFLLGGTPAPSLALVPSAA